MSLHRRLLVVRLVLGLSLLPAGGAQAATRADGILTHDATWTAEEGPYRIGEALRIGAASAAGEVTLTIEPGTRVELGERAVLRLGPTGAIHALGRRGSRILFTRAPGAERWGYVRIDGRGRGDETVFEYVTFEYGGASPGVGMVWVDGVSPVFDHCLFRHAPEGSLTVSGDEARPVFLRCDFLAGGEEIPSIRRLARIWIHAPNCYWRAASGPRDFSSTDGLVNLGGRGVGVDDYVHYEPWATSTAATSGEIPPSPPPAITLANEGDLDLGESVLLRATTHYARDTGYVWQAGAADKLRLAPDGASCRAEVLSTGAVTITVEGNESRLLGSRTLSLTDAAEDTPRLRLRLHGGRGDAPRVYAGRDEIAASVEIQGAVPPGGRLYAAVRTGGRLLFLPRLAPTPKAIVGRPASGIYTILSGRADETPPGIYTLLAAVMDDRRRVIGTIAEARIRIEP